MNGTESELNMIALINDLDDVSKNKADIDATQSQIEDIKKRSKELASRITQKIDDSIVLNLDVHERNPVLMWMQLAEDFNTIAPAQRLATRNELLNFVITEEDVEYSFSCMGIR